MWCDAFVVIVLSDEPGQNQGRGLVDRKLVKAPPPPPASNLIAGSPKAALLFFGSLVVLDVVFRCLGLFLIKKYFFLTRELSLINTCCWRADHEILIHDGASRSELIFESARQHMC